MPKVQRSPPVTKPTPSQAESDSSVGAPGESRKTTTRTKRLRGEASPHAATDIEQADLQKFKQELMTMLNTWKTEQDATLSRLVADITSLKSQCTNIQKVNKEIESSMTFMNAQFEQIKDKVCRLETERDTNRDYILSLEKQLGELQQRSRSSAMEIRNLPEKEHETERDLISTVKKLAASLEITFQDRDIRDIYRRPGKPGSTKAIVTEFNSVQVKEEIIASVRRFNKNRQISDKLNGEHVGLTGNKIPIFVDEYLPYSTRKLLFRAREFAKTHDYKFCWTSKGKVLLRKDSNARYIHIKTDQCLCNLSNKA